MIKRILKIFNNPKKILLYIIELPIFRLVPDKLFLKIKYNLLMKEKLNLNNPKTFNEKLQWLKLYDRKQEYINMVDKYGVKEYISKKIGKEYVIPTLGIWNDFDSIDFNKLPNKFVLKCTHDSGGLVICTSKEKFDVNSARNKINSSLKRNYYYSGREWPYKNVKPRIIAEKYMGTDEQQELIDYKFFCFNGKPEFLYVSEGLSNHKTAKISFSDMEYNKMPFFREDYRPFEKLPKKPINFEKMKGLAEKLSKNISFVRVDFYEINGKVYFGELTFFPCSGWLPLRPKEWDKKLGDMLKLPKEETII